jgi:hypothetical protein
MAAYCAGGLMGTGLGGEGGRTTTMPLDQHSDATNVSKTCADYLVAEADQK